MKSFIDYIIAEEKIPAIPKQPVKSDINYSSKTLNTGNYDIEILTTKSSAINYIIEFVFNPNGDYPLSNYEFFNKAYGKTKEDWEQAWKDFYEIVTSRNSSEDGDCAFIINGKYFNLADVSFDELLYIVKHLNQIEFFSHESGYMDVVYGGAVQPLDPYEEDEETTMGVMTNLQNWITDDKYEIKKIGKTEVVMKDKKNNIKYFK